MTEFVYRLNGAQLLAVQTMIGEELMRTGGQGLVSIQEDGTTESSLDDLLHLFGNVPGFPPLGRRGVPIISQKMPGASDGARTAWEAAPAWKKKLYEDVFNEFATPVQKAAWQDKKRVYEQKEQIHQHDAHPD